MNRTVHTLKTSACYEIVHYPQWNVLQITWLGHPTSKQYQDGTKRFLDYLKLYQTKKLLSDSQKRGNPLPHDLLWITHHLVPALCEENVQQLALVVPNNPNHARDLELCIMSGQVCYQLQFFLSPQEALDWLKTDFSDVASAAVA